MNKKIIKILAIDDNPENLISLHKMIRKTFPEAVVLSASDGLNGIKLAISEDPDIIFLDVPGPGINGFEICKRLKTNEKCIEIPVVFLIPQKAGKENRILALEAGAEAFLSKPIDESELSAQIMAMVKIKAANLNKRDKSEYLKNLLAGQTRALEIELDERKLAEEALRESNDMFSLFLKYSPIYAFIKEVTPTESRVIRASENYIDMVGIPGSEMEGKSMEELFPPEHAAKFTDDDWKVASTGKVLKLDEELNGRYYTTVKFPISLGGKILLAGYTIDITERKLAEDAIKVSEEKFRKAFLTSPDSININRLNDGMYITINKGFSQIMGYSEEEIIGKTSLELNIWKNPEDRKILVKGLKENGLVENLGAEFITKSGEVKYGLMSASVIEFEGELHILSITRDITVRKHLQEEVRKTGLHYQALIEKASDGIVLLDANGKFKYVSPSARKIFGFRISDEIHDDPNDLTHPADLPMVLSELGHVFKDPSYVPTLQYRISDRKMNYKWIESTISNLLADPNVAAIIINFRDITERKQAEEAILTLNTELERRVEQRTAQLEKSNKELEAFSYSVSHDLRAPLRHITGFIELFLQNKTASLTGEELGFLTTVVNSANEMEKLIDALLVFSRLNRTEPQKTILDTSLLIKHGLQIFESEIRYPKTEIHIDRLHKTYGDLQLMNQVWANLISNAIKYTRKKRSPIIEIGSYIKQNETIFFIKDNGAGFDMKYADKLFGVFQRLHKTRDFEGVGIGLANINSIIVRHGGRCWAEGKVDKGATFYFSLPGEIRK